MKSLKCEDAHDLVSCRRVHSCCISFHQHEQATNCVQCIFAISVEYSTMNEAVNHGPELWWWGWIKHRILGVLMGRGLRGVCGEHASEPSSRTLTHCPQTFSTPSLQLSRRPP